VKIAKFGFGGFLLTIFRHDVAPTFTYSFKIVYAIFCWIYFEVRIGQIFAVVLAYRLSMVNLQSPNGLYISSISFSKNLNTFCVFVKPLRACRQRLLQLGVIYFHPLSNAL